MQDILGLACSCGGCTSLGVYRDVFSVQDITFYGVSLVPSSNHLLMEKVWCADSSIFKTNLDAKELWTLYLFDLFHISEGGEHAHPLCPRVLFSVLFCRRRCSTLFPPLNIYESDFVTFPLLFLALYDFVSKLVVLGILLK